MAYSLGVNVDFGHGFSLGQILSTGAKWTRFPWNPGRSDRSIVAALAESGVPSLPVMDYTSFVAFPTREEAVGALLRDVGDLVQAVQIGNEPDGEGPSSWKMTHRQVNELLAAAAPQVKLGGLKVVGPGLCSGQAKWAEKLRLELLDELGVHLYVDLGAESVLADYASYGVPLRITEYHARSEWLGAWSLRYGPAAAFCLSDRMVPGFGLVEDGLALARFKELAGPSRPVYKFHLGQGMRAVCDRYGYEPLSEERYPTDNWSVALVRGSEGVRELHYSGETNRVYRGPILEWVE